MTDHQLRLPRAVLIANRGEIAVRIARTCRELGIRAIGVYSDVDAGAPHVDACDEAVRLGGAPPADSYLDIDLLLAAAAQSGADAIHPGFGFLAEAAHFAQAVIDAGLTWIGPTPALIAAMGDKLEAKALMAEAGVPLIPGRALPQGCDETELHRIAEGLGLPILVKAVAGGGGKGMRAVHHLDELSPAVAAARREAGYAFGDDRVFLERLIARPRHVEVQIVGDTHGNVLHLHERECSIQRRHQKVVEECPSPGIDDGVRDALTSAATVSARSLGYVSAGTVEFVVDEQVLARRRAGEDVAAHEAIAFLEVNTRLQVEHPVTEEVVRILDPATGTAQRIDLVRWQLLIAGGSTLPTTRQEDIVSSGHAIEVRLYAEDPANGFLPVTGRLTAFDVPAGAGIRRELGVRVGEVISPHYDPMLAKIIAAGATRAEAAARLAAVLDATTVLGVATNRALLAAVLRDEAFLAGETTTDHLEERLPRLLAAGRPDEETTARACLVAAVHAVHVAHAVHAEQALQVPQAVHAARAPQVPQAVHAARAPQVPQAVHPGQAGGAVDAGPLASRRGGGLASLPAGFVPSRVVWDQHAYVVGGAASGRTPHSDAASVLTVRVRSRRDGVLDVEVLRGIPPGFLDADGELVLATSIRVRGVGAGSLVVEFVASEVAARGDAGPAGREGPPLADGRAHGVGPDDRTPVRLPQRMRVGVAGDDQGRVAVHLPGRPAVALMVVPRFPPHDAEQVAGATRSPMPGVVGEVAVAVGDEVARGAVLLTVEAMKMEHRVTAPQAGRVAEVRVEAGEQVEADAILVVLGTGADG